jgi:hypothetical protein
MSDTERGLFALVALILLFAGGIVMMARGTNSSVASILRSLGGFILFMIGWAVVGSLPGVILILTRKHYFITEFEITVCTIIGSVLFFGCAHLLLDKPYGGRR